MYHCKKCGVSFARPYERPIDSGGIRDEGVIRKTNRTIFLGFCPNCYSRNYEKQKISPQKGLKSVGITKE